MADIGETRDIELMRRLSEGDEDAFSEFYRRHQGGLFRYAMHMAGRPEAAADVVQETFLTLIRHARKYDEEKGAPAAFLYGIARNHVRKLHEKRVASSLWWMIRVMVMCRNGTASRDVPMGMEAIPRAQGNRKQSWKVWSAPKRSK